VKVVRASTTKSEIEQEERDTSKYIGERSKNWGAIDKGTVRVRASRGVRHQGMLP
jgi:hypothetical protein